MTYYVKYIEDKKKEIKLGTLTNKGTVIKIIPTLQPFNLYITNTIINDIILDMDDNCFFLNDLTPLIPHLYNKKDDTLIGKVSDDALWVNETHTFTDKEIKQLIITEVVEDDYGEPGPKHWIKHDIEEVVKDWWIENPYYNSHKLIRKWGWKDAPDEAEFEIIYDIYLVKGPCGHFH